MRESELQSAEAVISDASAQEAARLAAAAIRRIGQIGREAGDAFQSLLTTDYDTDLQEGMCQIENTA